MDQRADAGDQEQEQRRELVVEQVHADVQGVALEPGEQVLADLPLALAATKQRHEEEDAEHERPGRERRTDPVAPLVHPAAGQRSADEQDGGADGGQGDDEPDQVEHTANTAGG